MTVNQIYAIQEQNSTSGAWELTGNFFTVGKEADAYVDKKNFQAVERSVNDSSEARSQLAKWTKRDLGEVGKMDAEELSELLKAIPIGLIGEFSDGLQCGGFFSYEVLGNCDGKDPE